MLASLLRQERVRSIIDSEIEQTYRKALEEDSKQFAGKRRLEDFDQMDRKFVIIDPIYERPKSIFTRVRIPYSEELRAKIVAWAEDFEKTAPAERKGAVGMLMPPITR